RRLAADARRRSEARRGRAMTGAEIANANLLIDLSLLTMLVLVAFFMVRSRQLFAIVMLSGIYSLLSAAFFVSLDAVDAAFTEAAVGPGVSTDWMLGAMLLRPRREKPITAGGSPVALAVAVLVGAALIYATFDMPAFGDAASPANSYIGEA